MRIDLFTADEVYKARQILETSPAWEIQHKILADIVTDETMARIDAETKQENDARYMAYRLQHIALSHPLQS